MTADDDTYECDDDYDDDDDDDEGLGIRTFVAQSEKRLL